MSILPRVDFDLGILCLVTKDEVKFVLVAGTDQLLPNAMFASWRCLVALREEVVASDHCG